ncbi:hypothetical protein B0W48_16795 [Pseudoalteromonas aliena]|uniref:Tyr recombinase domain-containing protein n=1 Tax=Pseudoalteromonas aliena TaxID=247523 RepID=A0A1Q2H1X8_9GAMM|nr:hypothetical protein [Pseudoalteromonas aliena]AQQ01281.1 hypothetical protein B0W48_16795 [Pseudoalteromonas aliena]
MAVVCDIDFDYNCIRIWDGKGGKNRVVTLAVELTPQLRSQIQLVDSYLQLDLKNPLYCGVYMPHLLRKKYPNHNRQLGWQYLFSSHKSGPVDLSGLKFVQYRGYLIAA